MCIFRVPGQKYCSRKVCQSARKNTWRRAKYADDIDYRKNQKDSTNEWLLSQGGAAIYYREYRQRKRSSNIELQSKIREDMSLFAGDTSGLNTNANSDVGSGITPMKSGRYRIFPASANSDAIIAEIHVITDG